MRHKTESTKKTEEHTHLFPFRAPPTVAALAIEFSGKTGDIDELPPRTKPTSSSHSSLVFSRKVVQISSTLVSNFFYFSLPAPETYSRLIFDFSLLHRATESFEFSF